MEHGEIFIQIGLSQNELFCPFWGYWSIWFMISSVIKFGFLTHSDHKLINTLELKRIILAPHHCFSFTGPPTYDRFRQHYICSLYQQTGWDPFPYPVMSSSGSVPKATNSRHIHPDQTQFWAV